MPATLLHAVAMPPSVLSVVYPSHPSSYMPDMCCFASDPGTLSCSVTSASTSSFPPRLFVLHLKIYVQALLLPSCGILFRVQRPVCCIAVRVPPNVPALQTNQLACITSMRRHLPHSTCAHKITCPCPIMLIPVQLALTALQINRPALPSLSAHTIFPFTCETCVSEPDPSRSSSCHPTFQTEPHHPEASACTL